MRATAKSRVTKGAIKGLRAPDLGFWVQGFGFRVQGLGLGLPRDREGWTQRSLWQFSIVPNTFWNTIPCPLALGKD